jgi:hypothetical protein
MRSTRLAFLVPLFAACSLSAADLLPPDRPMNDVIDHYVDARLARSGVAPAAQIDDYTLIRRTTLDLVGRIPTPPRRASLRRIEGPEQAEQLVDRLMSSSGVRPSSGDSVRRDAGRTKHPRRRWGPARLPDSALGENRPWDQIFRELLLPRRGRPEEEGCRASSCVRASSDLDRVTNDVSVVFFGVNVSCAQCHDHPLVSDWKQDHFYGMKTFFAAPSITAASWPSASSGWSSSSRTRGSEKKAR